MDQLRTELKRKRTGSGRKWPLAVAVIFFGLFVCLGAQPAWALTADFTANTIYGAGASLSVTFSDNSTFDTGAFMANNWDFTYNDGLGIFEASNNLTPPAYNYTTPGIYTVYYDGHKIPP